MALHAPSRKAKLGAGSFKERKLRNEYANDIGYDSGGDGARHSGRAAFAWFTTGRLTTFDVNPNPDAAFAALDLTPGWRAFAQKLNIRRSEVDRMSQCFCKAEFR